MAAFYCFESRANPITLCCMIIVISSRSQSEKSIIYELLLCIFVLHATTKNQNKKWNKFSSETRWYLSVVVSTYLDIGLQTGAVLIPQQEEISLADDYCFLPNAKCFMTLKLWESSLSFCGSLITHSFNSIQFSFSKLYCCIQPVFLHIVNVT